MNIGLSRSQAGFSLLELLVAFTIMAMSLGLIYKSMGTSARNVGDLTLHQQATMLAETLLNSRDSVSDQGWNESGVYSVFFWQVSSRPYGAPSIATEFIRLHEVDITVSWADDTRQKQLQAKTLLPQRKPLPGEVVR